MGKAPQENETFQEGKDTPDKKGQHVQKHAGLKGCGVLIAHQ